MVWSQTPWLATMPIGQPLPTSSPKFTMTNPWAGACLGFGTILRG